MAETDLKIKINSFKSGILWYACCEIPQLLETHSTYYYDNTPFVKMESPITLHVIGLSRNKVNKKMINKLTRYFNKGEY